MFFPIRAVRGTIRVLTIQLLAEADHLLAVVPMLLAVAINLLANVNWIADSVPYTASSN